MRIPSQRFMPLLLLLASCGGPTDDLQVANAMNAAAETQMQGDARAERLDEAAQVLKTKGNQEGGARGRELRDRAREKQSAASSVRSETQTKAGQIYDHALAVAEDSDANDGNRTSQKQ